MADGRKKWNRLYALNSEFAAERLCKLCWWFVKPLCVSSPVALCIAGATAHLAPTSDDQRTLAKTIIVAATIRIAHYCHPLPRKSYCNNSPPHSKTINNLFSTQSVEENVDLHSFDISQFYLLIYYFFHLLPLSQGSKILWVSFKVTCHHLKMANSWTNKI